MTQPPTPDQLLSIARQLRLVETLAWEPAAEPVRVHAEIQEAFRKGGLDSLQVMVATASMRLRRLTRRRNQAVDQARLPHQLIHATCTLDDPGLVQVCIQAVEGHTQGQPPHPPLLALLESGRGVQALIELLSISMTMAQQVTAATSGVDTPSQLLAQEAARDERAWLDPPRSG